MVPKIVDFGISQSDEDTRSAITLDGQILGTPSYMSPEQALGTWPVDARTDVWAVGVVLYEALAGAAPFAGSNHHRGTARICDDDPAPLREFVDDALRAIVCRCLEKDRARRYPTAAALREALESVSSGALVPAATVTRATREGEVTHTALRSGRAAAVAAF